MASSHALAFLSILVLPSVIAFGDWNETAIGERICEEVDCGKGTCVANASLPLNYMCQCQNGWIRYPYDDADDDYDLFLPCVIPNCTLNYGTCQPAPPPVAAKPVPDNLSIFDPCSWMYCGEGTCTKNGTCRHSCTCNPGYSNLLNVSYYPCYSECTLGSDCASLGIRVSSQQATPSGNGTTGAGGQNQGDITWHHRLFLFACLVLLLFLSFQGNKTTWSLNLKNKHILFS